MKFSIILLGYFTVYISHAYCSESHGDGALTSEHDEDRVAENVEEWSSTARRIMRGEKYMIVTRTLPASGGELWTGLTVPGDAGSKWYVGLKETIGDTDFPVYLHDNSLRIKGRVGTILNPYLYFDSEFTGFISDEKYENLMVNCKGWIVLKGASDAAEYVLKAVVTDHLASDARGNADHGLHWVYVNEIGEDHILTSYNGWRVDRSSGIVDIPITEIDESED